MVYLDNNMRKQAVDFPLFSAEEGTGEWSLVLTHRMTATDYPITRATFIVGRQYVTASFRLPDFMDVGEYVYTLTRGGIMMSHGLCVIGEYHEQPKAYESGYNVKEYGKYE